MYVCFAIERRALELLPQQPPSTTLSLGENVCFIGRHANIARYHSTMGDARNVATRSAAIRANEMGAHLAYALFQFEQSRHM